MSRHIRILAVSTSLAFLAACGSSATPDEALMRDLEQAQSASIELAPRAAGTSVVSAIESAPTKATSKASPGTSRRTTTPQRAPVAKRTATEPTIAQAPEPSPEPEPTPTVETIADSPAPTIDRPTVTSQPARRGRYKTTAEVIRDAPFPILPHSGIGTD